MPVFPLDHLTKPCRDPRSLVGVELYNHTVTAVFLSICPNASSTLRQPSSVLSEEISEESVTMIDPPSCTCKHREGCRETQQLTRASHESAASDSTEVRERLEELQGKVASLEQEKVKSIAGRKVLTVPQAVCSAWCQRLDAHRLNDIQKH